MKKIVLLLSLGVLLTVSCVKRELETQVLNVNFTPCQQDNGEKNALSGKVVVDFTNKGVQITHYKFEVACDFTTVSVTQTFINGVLRITQQGSPNQANCICYTDVSYTIDGISKKEVNVIFVNGVQVYCHNDDGDEDNDNGNCDQDVIISAIEYEKAPNFPVFIEDMKIVGNCLKIKFSSSGCGGETWIVKLIDHGIIAESNPCQRRLRLSLDSKEMCDAWITKEISFNIEELQIQKDNKILLNISGSSILYEY